MKKAFILFTLMVLAFQLPALAIETGAPAPDFSLTDSNGQTHSLSDFSGKHVVLEWINPDCPFVKKHYVGNHMQSLQSNNAANGVIWLSIASSAPGKQGHYSGDQWNEILARDNASPTALLLDPSGEVGRLYDAKTTPHMYIVGPDGTLIYQGGIDNNRSANPADIEGATNYVQVALDQALAGEVISENTTKPYGCSVKYGG